MQRDQVDQFFDRIVSGEPITRRSALRAMAAAGLTTSAAAFLAACGGVEGSADKAASVATTSNHPKAAIGTMVFSNWPLYIDKKIVPPWEKQYDAKLKYLEDINDNEEFFAKVRQELESGRSIGRDLVALTDYMAARWVNNGYVEAIDKTNVPNIKNLQPNLQHPPFDKNRTFTLPWQSGITGVGYNPKKTGGKLTSINDLWDPKFKGRISLLQDWHDSVSLVLLGMGKNPETATKDDFLAAIEKIDEENRKGQIRRFTGNDYAKDLTAGNLWACYAYSGDVVQLQADNPELEFLTPEEGGVSWSDNMMIPQKAKTPYGAETFMNYVYDPAVAAKLAAYVNYFCPVKGAKEEAEKIDPELAENQLIFPDDATLAKLHPQPSLSEADERELTAEFQKVTGA